MDFKKKLKSRLYIAIIYVILGGIMIAGGIITQTDNTFISAFGLTLVIMGIARIRQYFLITKNEETIKKQMIAETDERNISILNKAKSVTFSIYLMLSGIAVIILSFLNMHDVAKWIAYSMLLLVLIYWVAYYIIRKKS